MLECNRVHVGDVRELAPQIEPGSVQCLVTSPPYWGLRSYLPADHPDKHRELGSERTPQEFVANLVAVFKALRPALRDDGTLWVNLGDTYVSGGGAEPYRRTTSGKLMPPQGLGPAVSGIPPKSLLLMPAWFALAMQDAGWVLRSAITWVKTACMPESTRDRPTSATEQIYLFAKQPRYFYDAEAVADEAASSTQARAYLGRRPESPKQTAMREGGMQGAGDSLATYDRATRNARNYLILGPEPYNESHFAVFPRAIPRFAIRAGSSEAGACAACGAPWRRVAERTITGRGPTASILSDGIHAKSSGYSMSEKRQAYRAMGLESPPAPITLGWQPSCKCGTTERRPCLVLDPFMGSGTTAMVAVEENRDWLGLDLDPRAIGWTAGRLARAQRRLPLVEVVG